MLNMAARDFSWMRGIFFNSGDLWRVLAAVYPSCIVDWIEKRKKAIAASAHLNESTRQRAAWGSYHVTMFGPESDDA